MTIPSNLPADAIMMNPTEVAAALRISVRHLSDLVAEGKVPGPAITTHKKTRWVRQHLEVWAASLKPVAPTAAVA